MRFTVGIYKRHADPYKACFEDVAAALSAALRRLGHETAEFDNPGRLIVFGVLDAGDSVPPNSITFNTEQLTVGVNAREFAKSPHRDRVVWDYSAKNVEILRGLGYRRVVHCPIGYVPEMTRIEPAADEDIDVLFYGACSERRKRVMEKLEDAGIKAGIVSGVFGRDLDPYIARAKVVLNMHFYEQPIFEVVRCSHLWANKKCVVTEDGGADGELEALAERCATRVPYDKIVSACVALVQDDARRRVCESRGYNAFKEVNFVDSVQRALGES